MTQNTSSITDTLIEMERRALERWCRGDPSGFLEISAPDIVYFDPYQERRVDGLPALSELYEKLRGQVYASRFEILNPRVQLLSDAAVLTFNYVSWGASGEPTRWNSTEVYHRNRDDCWRIIQSHWSYTCRVTG